MKTLVWVVLVGSSLALGQSRSATLLDVPRADGASRVGLSSPSESVAFGSLFLKTAGVGVLASTSGILIGAGLGMLSNSLVFAALPLLLANLFLPPVVTVLVAMLMANGVDSRRFGFWLPALGAFAVNAVAFLFASLVVAVPWTSPAALLAYVLVDGLLMGSATVGVMALTEKKPMVVVKSFVPTLSDTSFVSLMKVSW
jgi:hypothetical protein